MSLRQLLPMCLFAVAVPQLVFADPQVYTVGPGGGFAGCMYTTVQAAVNAAAAHEGPDEIRVSVGNGGYTNQAVVVNDIAVTISGGYATCAESVPTGRTILSGAGGAAAAVLTIQTSCDTPVNIQIDHLELVDGDNALAGGGLFLDFCGQIHLKASRIAGNTAQSGGGIAVQSPAGDLAGALFVDDDVQIENNIATVGFGGGIYVATAALHLGGVATVVRGNRAAAGGGIALIGVTDSQRASAEVRSGGVDADGIISRNSATNAGGGIYAADFSTTRMFTTDIARPIRINANTATRYGGGMLLLGAQSRVSMWEGSLDANVAQLGAAAVAADDGAIFAMASALSADAPAGTLPCPANNPCNLVVGNIAADADGNPMPGAIGLIRNSNSAAQSEIHFTSANVLGNIGSNLFGDLCFSTDCARPMLIQVSNSRIVANWDTPALVETTNAVRFACDFCTIASLGSFGVPLFNTNGSVSLTRSILWEPGRDVIGGQTPSLISARDLLLHDRSDFPLVDFPPSTNIDVGDPRFVAQGGGNFRLQASSPALDRTAAVDIPTSDLDGNARALDQPGIPNRPGPVDLGAYERALDTDQIFANGFE